MSHNFDWINKNLYQKKLIMELLFGQFLQL